MTQYFTLMLLLTLLALPGTVHAAQICRSESEIPASTPNGQFVDHGNGTVTDGKTGLMWAKCSEGQSGSDCTSGSATTHSWLAAMDLANASTLAGHSVWRLPYIKELRSIVEEQCYVLAINLAIFPQTPSWHFWSASPDAKYSLSAWYVEFNYGFSGGSNRINGLHVRLVRGGE
jgi:hypothetical protein